MVAVRGAQVEMTPAGMCRDRSVSPLPFTLCSLALCSLALSPWHPLLSSLPLSFSPFFRSLSPVSRTSDTYTYMYMKSHVLLPLHCIRNGSQEPCKERRLRRVAGTRQSRRRCDGRWKFSALAPALEEKQIKEEGEEERVAAMRINSCVAMLVLSSKTLATGQGQ